MDWDKLRIFHATAEAGSFTHAGDTLNLSQSAVSRQVSALEYDLGVTLFNRHARGLVLTEQGDDLFRTAHDVFMNLEAAKMRLTDSKERPTGTLRVTTNVGLGSTWLIARINNFIDLYPEIDLQLQLVDTELDLNKRESDVAIRLHQPTQPDLIQRKLFTVHFHLYASADYLKRFGPFTDLKDIDKHRIVAFGRPTPDHLKDLNWMLRVNMEGRNERTPTLTVNNLQAMKKAAQRGVGVALLPDYVVDKEPGLVQLPVTGDVPSFDSYFVYTEDMRSSARVQAFRDFLVSEAQKWAF
ncbi:MAG: LysR family transcriptional regulator [Hyphomicrobiales bacterium]